MMRPVLLKSATLLLLAISIAFDRAEAQPTGTIALTGGVATDQRGVRSSAVSLAPSAVFASGSNTVSFAIGGNATRYTSQTFALGGGASVTALEPLGRFAAFTVSASANATALQGVSRATFAVADIVPAFELRVQALTLYGGLRGAASAASDMASSPQPTFPLSRTRSDLATITRQGIGPVYGAALAWTTSRATLRLGAREERLRVGNVATAERSASAGVSFALTPASYFEIGAGAYDANRLLGTPAGEYVTAGIAFRFGGDRGREPALPKPRGAKPVAPGLTRLSIRAPNAARVELAGDFNEWTPVPATRAENGVWYADLRIPPGQYRYAFRINGSEWRVPDGATAVDDGLGGKSATLVIPERGPGK